MDKWEGLVAVVTGASSGIGRAIAIKLALHGIKVAALARREHLLNELGLELGGEKSIYPFKCDVANESQVNETFEKIEECLGQVRILVNNAGIAPKPPFANFEIDKWRKMFDINVFGMFECIKQVVNSVKRNDPGLVHIININSLAGHYTTDNINIFPYAASKHCVTLLTRGLIKQIATDKMDIRVTSLSPGLVKTDIMNVQGIEYDYDNRAHLTPEEIADALISVLQQPVNVIISELTIKPAGELN